MTRSIQRNRGYRATCRWHAFAAALLVCCFVVAETFSAVHALDEAAHVGDAACKICIGAASLAAAATAPLVPQVVVLALVAAIAAAASLPAAARVLRLRPPARAPPILS